MANTKVTTRVIADDAITSDKLASGLTLGGDTTLSGHVSLADSKVVKLGDSADLQIRHNGTHSLITNTTGNLYIQDDGYVEIGSASGEVYIGAVKDGAVNLRYDNDKRIETSSGGVTITGTATATTFSGALSGTIASATTATTQSASDNSTKVSTTAYVTTAIANLVASAPSTLDTLNELAAALGDNENFATDVTASIATKLPLAGGTMTGTLAMGSNAITSTGTISSGAITTSGAITSTVGATSGARTFRDNYTNGALANQGFLRSSGGNYWGYSAYQDGSANWKSAVSVASERSVYAVDEDTAYWSHAPSQTVSIGSDLTTQPTKRVVFDLENTRVGVGIDSPSAPLHIQFSNNDGGVGGQLIKNTNTGTTSNFASLSTQAVNGTIQGTFGSAHYSSWGNAVVFAGSQTAHPFKMLTGNTVRATFDTSGNFGVNVTPTHKLHVLSTDNKGFLLDRNTGNEPASLDEFSDYYSLSIKTRANGSYLNFGGSATHTKLQATDGANSATAKDIMLNPYGGKIGIGFPINPQHELVVHADTNPTIAIVGDGYNDDISIRFGGGDLGNALGNSNSGAAIHSQQSVSGGQAKGDLQFKINKGDSLQTAMTITNSQSVALHGSGTAGKSFEVQDKTDGYSTFWTGRSGSDAEGRGCTTANGLLGVTSLQYDGDGAYYPTAGFAAAHDNAAAESVDFWFSSTTSEWQPMTFFAIGAHTNTGQTGQTAGWALIRATHYNNSLSVSVLDSGGGGTFSCSVVGSYADDRSDTSRARITYSSNQNRTAISVWGCNYGYFYGATR